MSVAREPQALNGRSELWRAPFTAVLAAGMAASTFAQYLFGVLAPFIRDDYGVSRSQLGFLTTAAFVIEGIGSAPAGRLVDRLGARRVFVGSMVLVTASLLGMAAAPSFALMLVGAGAVGGALCTCNPTTNKLVAEAIPPGRRGTIIGVKQAGVQVGAFAIGMLVPAAATALGWRPALAVTALVPALTAGGALRLVPRDPVPSAGDAPAGPLSPRTRSAVAWMTAYAFLMGAGVAVVSAYFPLYAEESIGTSANVAGWLAGFSGFIGILCRVAWGWGAERLGTVSLPLIVMGGGAVASTGLVLAAETAGPWLLWPAMALFGATAVTWNAVAMLAVVAIAPSHEAGRASGYVLTGFYAGFVVSPVAFGLSVDRTGTYAPGWIAVAATFAKEAVQRAPGGRCTLGAAEGGRGHPRESLPISCCPLETPEEGRDWSCAKSSLRSRR